MRLRVKDILLTETTSEYALDSLMHAGYTEDDAKVAISCGDIHGSKDDVTGYDGYYNVYKPMYTLLADGVEFNLRPDESGNIGTIG